MEVFARMVVLVLGATGMLGHRVMLDLAPRFDLVGTVRAPALSYAGHPIVGQMRLVGDVRAEDLGSIERALATTHPAVVLNCVGIIKQLPAAKSPLPTIGINALFPHQLAQRCQTAGAHLIHVSTDCVFSGRKGNYHESDVSDAEDLYGRTKYLGEVAGPGCLTLRTSIIGRELRDHLGLVDWFLQQRGRTVEGYARAIFSGLTTQALARVIGDLLDRHPRLEGLWHVSSDPISKYALLELLNRAFRLGVAVRRAEFGSFAADRSLDSSRFRQMTGFRPSAWPAMVQELADDPTPYPDWTGERARTC
jgi:dTDP-4-dehydrorhamnose reductase